MKKILTILYLVIFVSLIYYATTLFIDRDFKKNDIIDNNTDNQVEKVLEQPIDISDSNNAFQEHEETIIPITSDAQNAKYNITKKNCDNNCTTITNKNENEYCLQICGLYPEQLELTTCDGLDDLDNDYCLRNKAVIDKDLNGCGKIQDGGIKKQCLNRVNEDFIDEIM